MSDKITLLKQRYALEQRIRTLQNPKLTEGKNVGSLLAKMTAMLEHVNHQFDETGLPQDQIVSSWPINDKPKPQEIPVSEYDSHPDHEVQMARSELYRAAKCAMSLEKMLHHINEEQGLEGWIQAKITKAADYLESVYHYLDYEMRSGVEEATYGPGQKPSTPVNQDEATTDPNAPADPNAPVQAPGAPQQTNQQAPGQASATPQAGGSTPTATTAGMVKMAKLGPDKKPQGTPLMVRSSDIKAKQQQGFFVIGESKEEKKVVHCSQCGKGFSAAGVDAKYKTGFSHCTDHKGKKVIEEMASAGASSAGGIAGSPTGFASGGIGMQKRKKKKVSEDEPKQMLKVYKQPAHQIKAWDDDEGKKFSPKPVDPKKMDAVGRKIADVKKKTEEGTMTDAEKEGQGPKFTGYWKGTDKGKPGKKMVGGE